MSIKDKKIGFIGLGAMGRPMARNILKAGFDLGVYNRTESRAEAFRDEGATVFYAPWELAEICDVTIIMVTGPDDLLEIIDAIKDVIKGGKIVVNMSTVSLDATMEAAEIVYSRGCHFVDAPVLGSTKPAADGNLVILNAGGEATLDELQPLFQAMGKTIIRCGSIGMATKMKIVVNVLLGNTMTAFAESLAFGRKMGLDASLVINTLTSGALGSPFMQIKGKAITENNYQKTFPVDLIFKDLNLALKAAGQEGMPLTITSATREAYSGAIGMGLGDEDMAAVVKYYEKIADIIVMSKEK
jgi:3-hydroxyisobutyrate dehydrogenase-like beta-hydroxyacid dehydrogenase